MVVFNLQKELHIRGDMIKRQLKRTLWDFVLEKLHRITELFRLEKTWEIIESNHFKAVRKINNIH